ncbi:heme peroxidase [Aspergillus pseudodeflectus]|uniref:Peroxidase n=1 Tax=Aspergillus pseudodeflectus TaxID=176178 RepID=A0ABR4K512_9EURO
MSLFRRTASRAAQVSPARAHYVRGCHQGKLTVIPCAKHAAKRGFATTPSSASAAYSRWTFLLGAGLAVSGAATFLYTKQETPTSLEPVHVPSQEDYQKVYNEVARLLAEMDEYDDGSYGPVVLRLSWHASGTFDKNTGTGGKMFPWISYSDLWTLAGVTAVQELGGPTVPWRPGRHDADSKACTPDGRLPNAAKGPSHLRDIFYRMGFDDREIVALSGAHALGRAHTDRTGYEGPWDFSPTVFTNEFFRLLVEEEWLQREWEGPLQYTDKTTKTLMMLPTDMALVEDAGFRPHVERYAKDSDVFFQEFADAYVKLLELGVPFKGNGSERWVFEKSD